MSNYPKTRKPATTPRTGRPVQIEAASKTSIWLTAAQKAWCSGRNMSASAYIRMLIDADIEAANSKGIIK